MKSESKMMTRSAHLIAFPFSDALTATSFVLPPGLTSEQWLDAGRELGRVDSSAMWWTGDWWAYGEHTYGDRSNFVQSDEWEGPSYQTCKDAAWVCRRFERSRRRDLLSFSVHKEVASLEAQLQDEILTWAENAGGSPRPRSEIRERVKQVKSYLAQGWTPDQLDRKVRAERGECVTANIREDRDGRRIDEALLAWAEAGDRFVRIDRKTDWGNPFEIPQDGERDEVVGKFAKFYLPHKTGLLSRINREFAGKGKVLGCWCHPEECHGHVICEVVNRVAAGEGSAEEVADKVSEFDG